MYQVKRNNDIKLKVQRYLFNSKTKYYKEIYNCMFMLVCLFGSM